MSLVKLGMEVTVGNINAYYNFKLEASLLENNNYRLLLGKKIGNNEILNSIFENHEIIRFKEIGPLEDLGGFYAVSFTLLWNNRKLPAAFRASIYSLPVGELYFKGIRNTILFRLKGQLEFEVFVFNDDRRHALNYLQLLIDGYLEKEIEFLKDQI